MVVLWAAMDEVVRGETGVLRSAVAVIGCAVIDCAVIGATTR